MLKVSLICAVLAVMSWPVQPRRTILLLPIDDSNRTRRPSTTIPRLSPMDVGIVVLAATLGWLLADLLGFGIGIVAGVVLVAANAGRPQHRDRERALVAQAPTTFELLACALQAGLPLSGAVAAVADISSEPTREVLHRVTAQLSVGSSQREAWDRIRHEPGWQSIARDLTACAESGSGLAELFLDAARDAREERLGQIQKEARSLNVRSVFPMMCCFLPSFVLVGVVPIVAGVLTGGLFGS